MELIRPPASNLQPQIGRWRAPQRPLEAAFQLHAVAMPTRVVWAALQPPPGWKRSSLEDLRSRAVVLNLNGFSAQRADGCTHTSRYALHSFRSFIAPPLSLRPPSTNPNPEEAVWLHRTVLEPSTWLQLTQI